MFENIFLIHNYYQSYAPSGEDNVFREDEKLLRSKGHKITLWTRHSDIINEYSLTKKIALTWQISWSSESYKAIEQLIKQNKPDIIHICNTFPLISPSVYYACNKYQVPVVQTIQNYRLFCSAGTFFRNNSICEECLEKGEFQAIRHRCYRGSRIHTLPIVFMQKIHKLMKTWLKYVHIFMPATEFSRQKLIQGGIPAERIMVKPNFFLNMPEPSFEIGDYVVFLGRLSVEKGIRTLLSAWNKLQDIPLKIIGDGNLRQEVISATKSNPAIEFLGFRSNEECIEILKKSMFMVMPSEWYEGFPMTIREAFACGKPVVASRMGAMAEIINDSITGLLFNPGDPSDLALKVRWLVEHKDFIVSMGKSARSEFETKYTAEKNYEILMNIYKRATEISKSRNQLWKK
ncbi:MAG: glycosyltransferase family 4 protein [candidate division WOR-3 bacterium]